MNLVLRTSPLKTIAIASLFLIITSDVVAQTTTSTTGRFTHIQEGQAAPFDGTLFDPVAVAKILTDKQTAKRKCEIDLEYNKKLLEVKCNRDTKLLKSELDIEKKKYDLIVNAQREEISTLRELAKGGDNTLWATIGFALGAITSVAIFFAAVKVSQ